METDMTLRALMLLGFAGFIAQPALAQTPPAAAPAAPATGPTTTSATFDNVLALGYEVKTVTVLSDAATKEVFSGTGVLSQVFISLQKGTSVAVCELSTATWLSLDNGIMTDTTRCKVR